MARKLKYPTGPVVSIAIDGHGVAWCDKIFTNSPGGKHLGDMARKAARTGLTYRFRRCEVTAGADTPLEALAAMAAFAPGRVEFRKVPLEVLQYLAAGASHV
ncbi:hypothetical protein [Arthrobacter sp. 162MFSha1.1]|uniref:hypothetical protein n=1 Tax=Arthrobacter sp. 162MFSha1.1 TaxID=1151119 RepID=UPI000367E23E|nr:hypothetical protein [Arthrobacter sp. 162MFSha1.1]